MNLFLQDLAPAIVALVAAAFGLFLVWLAVRQAHSGRGKPTSSRRRKPDPNPAE